MPNPIFNNGSKPPVKNNAVNNLLQFINNGGNINTLTNQLLNNPQLNQQMTQMKNMVGNRTPKEVVIQMAKQQGIDPNQIMQLANKMGLK